MINPQKSTRTRRLSLFFSCLLIGQFQSSLYAMAQVIGKITQVPAVAVFMHNRELIRQHGAQVPLSGGIFRKNIANVGNNIKRLQAIDVKYNQCLKGVCALACLFTAWYLAQAAHLYIHNKLRTRQVTTGIRQHHKQLVEQKILNRLPAHLSTKNAGSIVASFLDWEKEIEREVAQMQPRHRSQQRYLLKNFLGNLRNFIARPIVIASFLLFLAVIFMTAAGDLLVFLTLLSSAPTALVSGTQAAKDTLSLLVYHDFDKFRFITAPLLVCKYGLICLAGAKLGIWHDTMRMP